MLPRATIEASDRQLLGPGLPFEGVVIGGSALFAEGRLRPVGGSAGDVNVGGRALGPMVLVEVRSAGERHDVATLVFKPRASPGGAA